LILEKSAWFLGPFTMAKAPRQLLTKTRRETERPERRRRKKDKEVLTKSGIREIKATMNKANAKGES